MWQERALWSSLIFWIQLVGYHWQPNAELVRPWADIAWWVLHDASLLPFVYISCFSARLEPKATQSIVLPSSILFPQQQQPGEVGSAETEWLAQVYPPSKLSWQRIKPWFSSDTVCLCVLGLWIIGSLLFSPFWQCFLAIQGILAFKPASREII